MNENFLTNAKDGAVKVYKAFADYLAAQAKLSTAKREQATAQIQKINKQDTQANLWPDYNNVSNGVFDCLSSNYAQCGLCRPHTVADVYMDNIELAIDVDFSIKSGSQVVFSFEANRIVSDLYMGGMKRLEYPRASHDDIEAKLKKLLPKYVRIRGYAFADIQVTDCNVNNVDSVIVTLRGVHRWGYYTGGLLL